MQRRSKKPQVSTSDIKSETFLLAEKEFIKSVFEAHLPKINEFETVICQHDKTLTLQELMKCIFETQTQNSTSPDFENWMKFGVIFQLQESLARIESLLQSQQKQGTSFS